MPNRVQRLREAAQARHEHTLARAEEAIRRQRRRGGTVTYRSLAEAAGVSRSWLYRQESLRQQIDQLRDYSATRARTALPRPSEPPPTRCVSNCTPTVRRSPGSRPKTKNCANNSPAASAPTGLLPSPHPPDPRRGHVHNDNLPALQQFSQNRSREQRLCGIPHNRHTFATAHMTAAYAHDGDPDRVLSLLATWLGHSDAAHTYWYLSATGELMALAAGRLELNAGTTEGEPS